jgi:hypothetical protein
MRYEISDRINIYLLRQKKCDTTSLTSVVPSIFHKIIEEQENTVDSCSLRCYSIEEVEAALEYLRKCQLPNKRCIIQDAFSSPSSVVQTVAAKLCDAGCTHLILGEEYDIIDKCAKSSAKNSTMAGIDADDVREVVEAVLWNDVVGTPMSERVGIRAHGSSSAGARSTDDWESQIMEALDLNLKNFDASFDGKDAPSWEELVKIIEKRGLKHNLISVL